MKRLILAATGTARRIFDSTKWFKRGELQEQLAEDIAAEGC